MAEKLGLKRKGVVVKCQ